jgi:hypothetical protein
LSGPCPEQFKKPRVSGIRTGAGTAGSDNRSRVKLETEKKARGARGARRKGMRRTRGTRQPVVCSHGTRTHGAPSRQHKPRPARAGNAQSSLSVVRTDSEGLAATGLRVGRASSFPAHSRGPNSESARAPYLRPAWRPPGAGPDRPMEIETRSFQMQINLSQITV